MEFKPDNFDQEFSLNNSKKNNKRNGRGKIPSWLMILVGVAAVGGVVAARQPVIRPAANNTRASISIAATQSFSGDNTVITGINDQKADASELEARFATQNGPSAGWEDEIHTEPTLNAASASPEAITEETKPETEKPAASGETEEITVPSEPETEKPTASGETEEITVSAEPETEKPAASGETEEITVSAEPEIEKPAASGETEEITVSAEPETEKPAASDPAGKPEKETDKDQPEDAAPETDEKEDPSVTAEEPLTITEDMAIAWLNDKPYAVSIVPVGENGAEAADPGKNNKQEKSQTTVFSVDGKNYELQLTEIDPENEAAAETDREVVWIDKTPLKVALTADDTPASPENSGTEAGSQIRVSLVPLTADQTAALQQERFGDEFIQVNTEEPAPEPAVTEEPIGEPVEEPTPEPANNNWFVNIFNNIFGSAPTQTPTPEVTIVVLSPTPTVVPPTATSIVVRMVTTPVVREPVRLDQTPTVEPTEIETKEIEAKEGDLDDPALRDEGDTPPAVQPTATPEAMEAAGIQQPTENPTEQVDAALIDTGVTETPAVRPTQEELPHTGMAEDWNIPSLLTLLAGLLLIIVGIRRLRTKQDL